MLSGQGPGGPGPPPVPPMPPPPQSATFSANLGGGISIGALPTGQRSHTTTPSSANGMIHATSYNSPSAGNSPQVLGNAAGTTLGGGTTGILSRKDMMMLRKLTPPPPFTMRQSFCFGLLKPKHFYLLLTLLVPLSALLVVLILSVMTYRASQFRGGSGAHPGLYPSEDVAESVQESQGRQASSDGYIRDLDRLPQDCLYHAYVMFVQMCPIRRPFLKRFMEGVKAYQQAYLQKHPELRITQDDGGSSDDENEDTTSYRSKKSLTRHSRRQQSLLYGTLNVATTTSAEPVDEEEIPPYLRERTQDGIRPEWLSVPPPKRWPTWVSLSNVPRNPFFILKSAISKPFSFPSVEQFESAFGHHWLPFDMKDGFLTMSRRDTLASNSSSRPNTSSTTNPSTTSNTPRQEVPIPPQKKTIVDPRTFWASATLVNDQEGGSGAPATTGTSHHEEEDILGMPLIFMQQPTWFDALKAPDLLYRQFRYAFAILLYAAQHPGHQKMRKMPLALHRLKSTTSSSTTSSAPTSNRPSGRNSPLKSPPRGTQSPRPNRPPSATSTSSSSPQSVIWIALLDGFILMVSPHLVIGFGPVSGLASLIQSFPSASIQQLLETYLTAYTLERQAATPKRHKHAQQPVQPATPFQSIEAEMQLLPGHILHPATTELLEDQWDKRFRIQDD